MDQTDLPGAFPVILPASPPVYQAQQPTSLTSAILDSEGIARLLGALLEVSGMNVQQVSRRLGLSENCVREYTKGRRTNPTIRTFVKIVDMMGGRVWVDFPKRSR